jgi:hypothetical protein
LSGICSCLPRKIDGRGEYVKVEKKPRNGYLI